MVEMTHSQVGASSCERWWHCPGSCALSAKLPPAETSKYAAEGTAAHAVCENYLKNKINFGAVWKAECLIGEVEEVEDFEIKVTQDMTDGAELYVKTIYDDIARIDCTIGKSVGPEKRKHYDKKTDMSPNPSWVNIEKGFELKDVDKDARGTNDASIFVPGEILIVYDYKYGQGIPVDAVENKQMAYYAIGAAGDKLMDFKTIEFVIVQPRAPHPDGPVRRWITTPEYVAKFKEELKARIALTRESNAKTNTGKWCRFCNAKLICPAMRTSVNNIAKMDFQTLPEKNITAVRNPSDLSSQELKLFLDNAEILENYIKSIREYAFNLLDRGGSINGYKLVRGGKKHRKWKDESTVADMLELELGAETDDLYSRKLKTPSQIEKTIKDSKTIVAEYCYRPEGELTLVREEDMRDEQKPTAITDFSNVTPEIDLSDFGI